jgi:hypothetical protein
MIFASCHVVAGVVQNREAHFGERLSDSMRAFREAGDRLPVGPGGFAAQAMPSSPSSFDSTGASELSIGQLILYRRCARHHLEVVIADLMPEPARSGVNEDGIPCLDPRVRDLEDRSGNLADLHE